MDPLSMAVGAGLLAAGAVAGRLLRRRQKEPTRPVCGCGHSLAEHDRAADRCHGQNRRKSYGPMTGVRMGWAWVPCTCRRYVGPVPVEDLWTPPILPTTKD